MYTCISCGSHNIGIDGGHMEMFCRDCGAIVQEFDQETVLHFTR